MSNLETYTHAIFRFHGEHLVIRSAEHQGSYAGIANAHLNGRSRRRVWHPPRATAVFANALPGWAVDSDGTRNGSDAGSLCLFGSTTENTVPPFAVAYLGFYKGGRDQGV
jgi:hypothetical protein